jgi:hypothetical protein
LILGRFEKNDVTCPRHILGLGELDRVAEALRDLERLADPLAAPSRALGTPLGEAAAAR